MNPASTSTEVADLYRAHHGWLHSWLSRKINCVHEASDLAHDVFLRVIGSRRSSLGQEPRALLTHIAKGLVIDHWRHQAVEQAYLEVVANLPEQHEPSPEAKLIIIEALVKVDAMLSGLPGRTREIFLLAQLDGLTLQQIAERTKTPLITVRRHIHKALMTCMSSA